MLYYLYVDENGMFVTPLRLYPIPRPYLQRVGRITPIVHHLACGEVLAWLRGEGASIGSIANFINVVDDFNSERVKIPPLPAYDNVTINTKDYEVSHSKVSLRRRFHFFDDFFSDFPDEAPTIPYSAECLTDTLEHTGSMEDCLECMRFLNPKDDLEYLYLSTDHMDEVTLLSLIKQLTDEEKTSIMERHRWQSSACVSLPYEGTDRAILACVLRLRGQYETEKRLFSDRPSYLYTIVPSCEKDHLLLTADFSHEWVSWKYHSSQRIIQLLATGKIKTREEVKRCLTMLGIRSPFFGNDNDYIALPYNEAPDLSVLRDVRLIDVVENVSAILGENRLKVAMEINRYC